MYFVNFLYIKNVDFGWMRDNPSVGIRDGLDVKCGLKWNKERKKKGKILSGGKEKNGRGSIEVGSG